MAVKTSELYNLSGKPKIKKDPSLYAKMLKLVGLDYGIGSSRAHMLPILNTMYNIETFSDFLAELSHFYNNRQIGWFNQGFPINGISNLSAYEKPYSLEHTTHSYTEPLLKTYIESANIPEYKYINPKYINETIKNKVKEDRKQILKFTKGGFVNINNLNKNDMKKIKKINQQNNVDNILFKCGGSTKKVRKKAFWGALIGAGVSALGSIITNVIGANKAKKDAEENAMKEQTIIANQNLQRKRAAEQEYYNQYNANSSVYKDLYNQINSAKMGGKFKRVKRKKAEFGLDGYGNIFSGLINSGSNIINAAIQNRTNDEIQNIRNRIISNNAIAPNYGILNFDSLKLIK